MRDRTKVIGTWGLGVLGVLALAALVHYMSGVFATGRIAPDRGPPPPSLPAPARTAVCQAVTLPVWYVAVGTIRSKTTANIAAQVSGIVVEVAVEEGDAVVEEDFLLAIAGAELEARLAFARSSLEAAVAASERERLQHERLRRLFDEQAATSEDLETAEAMQKQSAAEVEAARQKLEEASVAAGYARILSPVAGVVSRREVDPGDLAWPGKPLLVIHDPGALRLEADVREGLVRRVEPGVEVEVELTSLGRSVSGTVDEFVPSADPVSRSFRVRVALPEIENLYPGMFARMRLPVGQRRAVTVPAESVTAVGQLRTVVVEEDGRWERRYVTAGETRDGSTEILSGLSGGETVGIPES